MNCTNVSSSTRADFTTDLDRLSSEILGTAKNMVFSLKSILTVKTNVTHLGILIMVIFLYLSTFTV